MHCSPISVIEASLASQAGAADQYGASSRTAIYCLHRVDRAFRLAVIAADQAIQGEGSVRFTDSLPLKPLAEGACKFHVSDGVGFNVDKLYGETFVFDRLLRLIRRHFGWGTGHLIYRSIAQKFDEFVEDFRRQERDGR